MTADPPDAATSPPPPPAPPSDQITFDVVRRGFDRVQVTERLGALGERIRELETGLAGARGALAEAGGTSVSDPFEAVSRHVRELVEAFDHEVDRQRRKAELEATVVMAEARTEAAQMRLEARAAEEEALAEAERLLRVAQADAATLRREALALRESTLTELRGIRDRMRSSLHELESGLSVDGDGGRVIVLEEAQHDGPPPVTRSGGAPAG
jgi:hypothetical protein